MASNRRPIGSQSGLYDQGFDRVSAYSDRSSEPNSYDGGLNMYNYVREEEIIPGVSSCNANIKRHVQFLLFNYSIDHSATKFSSILCTGRQCKHILTRYFFKSLFKKNSIQIN